MNRKIKNRSSLGILASFIFMSTMHVEAFADQRSSIINPELGIALEMFLWKEYGANGKRLLTESGPRARLLAGLGNEGKQDSGLIFNAYSSAYVGLVDYDGQTQAAVPLKSDTTYYGGSLEATGGYRFGGLFFANNVDLMVGVGVEFWEREIAPSTDAFGNNTASALEEFQIKYSKLGLGLTHRADTWQGYFQLGVKKPFSTEEEVGNGHDVTLSPGKNHSFYSVYKITLSRDENRQGAMLISVYYDSFRFDKSAPELSKSNLKYIWQPESSMDVMGISVGRLF